MKKILVGLVLIAFGIWLWKVPSFHSTPDPARDYQAALDAFSRLEEAEAMLPLSPQGRSRLFVQGRKTKRAFVLLHGLTNCPEQFVPMAKILQAGGANVIIPRARYAGYADRLNNVQGNQSGQDLIDQAAEGLDIAAGLGEEITLVGLSGSAVAAAWMAQNRPGIDSVVICSPFFGMYDKPVWEIDALSAILSRAPNFYVWWDEKLQADLPGPAYAYPRFGTKCFADTLQLSRNVRAHLSSRPLQVRNFSIITSASDRGVNNALTAEMAAEWKEQGTAKITTHEFPEADGVPHDCIDPNQPDQKTALTYPLILGLPGMNPK